jgi:hypothetical protein
LYNNHIDSNKQELEMKVYVVLEEDRGCGVSVAGVFTSLAEAKLYLRGPDGSNCYLASEDGEEVQYD